MLESINTSRLEDGNRAIAQKIIQRLDVLERTIKKNCGRWAWELLQNAKDSIAIKEDKKISIKIEYNKDSLTFRHNGIPFTEYDVRGIINQISSKEIIEGEQTRKTGRFGTGFMTTHLLSRKVHIKGISKSNHGNQYYAFDFLLDRTAKQMAEFISKLDETWKAFANRFCPLDDYDETDMAFHTSFSYLLESDKQHEVAKIGLDEFIKLLPLVLAFIPKLESAEIIDQVEDRQLMFKVKHQNTGNGLMCIQKTENDVIKDIFIGTKAQKGITIAVLLKQIQLGFEIESMADYPKLFCDFPLAGTERFHFPFIINSSDFNPLTERDGLYLKDSSHKDVQKNQSLIADAVLLAKQLIQDLAKGNFYNLYNITGTTMPNMDESFFDKAWFKTSVQAPLRNALYEVGIVEIEDSSQKRAIKSLYFPSNQYSGAVQSKLWQFLFDLNAESVCKKAHLTYWNPLSWNTESIPTWYSHQLLWNGWNIISYSNLLEMVEKYNDITTLSKQLNKNEADTLHWLNNLYDFVLENGNGAFYNKAIIPNQKGVFRKKTDLKADYVKDELLVEILAILGDDWKEILIHSAIQLKDNDLHPRDKQQIANAITKAVNEKKEKEKVATSSNEYTLDESFAKAILLLMKWFDNHSFEAGEIESKSLFPELHQRKAEIFLNTISDKENLYKIMRSNLTLREIASIIEQVDENPSIRENVTLSILLTDLFTEFSLENMDELRQRLQNTIPIEDKDLTNHVHYSTPSFEKFQYAKEIRERAKQNVIKHLKTLINYDCTNLEELTENVISRIKKNDIPITVIIRPSDYGVVIIYSDSEKEYLKFEDEYTELWVDNGKDLPQYLTLGKVIKKLGINKI
ncbi:MAG: hypothetical protein RLZZ628_279 [Bacteroidota bacterium]|jgi:hypothetical protein